jgi:predicted DNA-binding transcriptional regulator AlpA
VSDLADDVITSQETSEMTRVKEGTLRYWRSTHQGPAWFRLGPRRIAYLRRDVERWMSEQYERSYRDPSDSAP